MEETIDLKEYLAIIKKRFWIVILTTIISVGISALLLRTSGQSQLYQAKTTLIVNVEKYENQPNLTSDQISAGEKLAVLYGEIIKSRSVLQPVINKLNLDITPEQLASMISISQVNETHIMNLAVTDTNPDRAKDIANTIPGVFTEEVKRTIKASGVEVLDPALGANPVSQGANPSNKIVIAGVLGITIGLFVIFLIEFLDNKIKTPQDIDKYIQLPILGVIPDENNKNNLLTMNNPKSPISEVYRDIRTSIQFSNIDRKLKTINVTSSDEGEGKTTVLVNLANTFAGLDKKVLLIEGDLRNPYLHSMFSVSNVSGLTNILLEEKTFEECVHCTNTKNLHVLTCGATPPNPSEMLASNKMITFINSLKESYDYIFIDTPPIGMVTDAGIVSTYSDGCIFVVGAKAVDAQTLQIAKEKLTNVGANILGVVLNKFEVNKRSNDYYSHYYAKTKQQRKKKNKKKNRRMENAI